MPETNLELLQPQLQKECRRAGLVEGWKPPFAPPQAARQYCVERPKGCCGVAGVRVVEGVEELGSKTKPHPFSPGIES
jgi:hypothetical protein